VNNETGLACRPNIGPRERRRRSLLAAILAAAAIAGAVTLFASGAPRSWRLAIALPAWAAVLCYLEARSHTCVLLAARGLRNLDLGNERVDDATERRASTAQSTKIYLWSTAVAGIATAALMLLP
jgi:hypothetical protein